MRKGAILLLIVLLSLAPGTMSQAASGGKEKQVIEVSGAASMFGRIHTLSKQFASNNPAIVVKVVSDGTVDKGFQDLLSGKANVVMASRHATDEERRAAQEKSIQLVERLIGYGGIVIVTHPRIPLSELTVEQLKKVSAGEYQNWNQLGGPAEPITVFRTGSEHPGTLYFLEKDFLGGVFGAGVKVVVGFPKVIESVAKTPGAIGFVRIRDAFETPATTSTQVKVIGIKVTPESPAVMPSRDTVKSGTYPICRPYYFYLTDAAGEGIKQYVDFVVQHGWGRQDL
jgi:phosphate transport system substrate-binding protein